MDWSSIFNPGTLLGLVLAVLIYFKQKRRKEISWVKRSSQIITSTVTSFPNLKMLYKNEAIQDLTVTKLAFWNSGTDAIKNDDIYKDEPIAVIFGDHTKVLDASIVPESNSNEKFGLIQTESKCIITIERTCAEKQEGAVVQIIHTGDGGDIKLDGAIVEGNKKFWKEVVNRNENGWVRRSAIFFAIAPLATFVVFNILDYVIPPTGGKVDYEPELAFFAATTIGALSGVAELLLLFYKIVVIPKITMPKSLEKYFF